MGVARRDKPALPTGMPRAVRSTVVFRSLASWGARARQQRPPSPLAFDEAVAILGGARLVAGRGVSAAVRRGEAQLGCSLRSVSC